MARRLTLSLFLYLTVAMALAQPNGPVIAVRRVPPPGIAVSSADRAALEGAVTELGREIEALRTELRDRPASLALLPDVQIYHKAVQWPLTYGEFYRSNEVAIARSLLRQGMERARQLREGSAPWTTASGLVVRGYLSRIDGSVQPYGLVVPASYHAATSKTHRLDVWLHGRDNSLTELKFMDDRQKRPGEFMPADSFVLHPYGRYCNAFKFAGEVDVFEALEHARNHYPIDENRVSLRGFSMGGAGCWHLAVHHAGLWAVAAPGAGFAETPVYSKLLQKQPKPAWYEQKLWHLYDATDYAANLFNCPTIAYSGEIDKQKQAADMMAKAMQGEGLELTHIIGPGTEHKYHPKAKAEINERVDGILAAGRNPLPRKVRFTTWTLRYNQMLWVTVDGMAQHWERARVDADIVDNHTLKVKTENVLDLTFAMPPGLSPLDATQRPKVILDGQDLTAGPPLSDRSWKTHFRKLGNRWRVADSNPEGDETISDGSGTLRKRHGLQGPIDDAFMDSFILVRPTGSPMNEAVGRWTRAEMTNAIEQWRAQFRGDIRIKNDVEITDADQRSNHLVIWGDPVSNKLLAGMAEKLPIAWNSQAVRLGKEAFPADDHVPVYIYPNPLNPKRYVVINSGFTFSAAGPLSNALQVPLLPDYAVVRIPVSPRPAQSDAVVTAGFFDEGWSLPRTTR